MKQEVHKCSCGRCHCPCHDGAMVVHVGGMCCAEPWAGANKFDSTIYSNAKWEAIPLGD